MAIVAVAATRILASSGSTASGAVSATAGNALIVGSLMFNTGSVSVTRTGDAYTTDANGDVNTAGSGILSAPNCAGGSVTMNITCTAGDGISVFVLEASGLPSSSIRDATSPATASGNSATATTGSLTNATANALYVAVVSTDSTSVSATVTVGGSFIATVGATTMTQTNTNLGMIGGMAYQIVSSATSRTATWAITSADWTTQISVYRAAAVTAFPPGLGPAMHMEPTQTLTIGW